MYQDVKFIKGVLYYEELDGKWYPVPLSFRGGGGGGKKITNNNITNQFINPATLLFNSTADHVVVSPNGASIMPTVGIGSSVIPANFFTDGKKISVKIGGKIFVPVGGDVIFGTNPFVLKLGGQDILLSTNNFAASDNQTVYFNIDAELTYRAAGTMIVAEGSITIGDGSVGGSSMSLINIPIVIDPTSPNAFDITASLQNTTVTTTITSIESPTLIS